MILLENTEQRLFSKLEFEEGVVFLVDKPKNWTSFDVVNKMRWELRRITKNRKIKVGHAGTLDPLATGLLLICSGKMTKQIDQLMAIEKSYTGIIRLGATTASLDAETPIDAHFDTQHIDNDVLEAARIQFLGKIEQIPPVFSAIKVDGKALYKDAHKGNIEAATEKLKPRNVEIFDFQLKNSEYTGGGQFLDISFFANCSKGTYIRSLARDFGAACQSGGFLNELRRVAIGQYSVEKAWDLENLIQYLKSIE